VADRALDFFDVLYYDGGADCGHNADHNLAYCLDSSLAFMLNSSTIWNGVKRLHFFITYSNDIDRGTPKVFVGTVGEAKWMGLVSTWVSAMQHHRYLKVGGRPVFKVLIPSIFITECGQNATLATLRLAQLTAAAKAAGLQAPLIGGGWQNPSTPANTANPNGSPRPHPQGYMRYNNTHVDCHTGAHPLAGGCTLKTVAAASIADCQQICNYTLGCTAITVEYATNYTRSGPPLSCAILTRSGPGGGNATCDTYVRVPGEVEYDWTGTYNAAPPPDPTGMYTNSWWPNDTATGAKIFPYRQVGDYQGEARTNHSHDRQPYLPNVIAGFAPGPWEEHAPSFAFPTQPEWEAVLRQVKAQCEDLANHFGFPDPTSPGGFQPAFNIYAWNELGEGGIMAPTRGDGYMKLDTIATVFNRSHKVKTDDEVPLLVTSATPDSFATAVSTTVTIVGSGFVVGTPSGWRLRCRLESACKGDHTCTTFVHAGYGGGTLYANATVINDTHTTCVAPSVFVPGPGLLSVCLTEDKPSPWVCNGPSNGTRISYFSLVDAVLSRRPYINESQAELLVTIHPSLAGNTLQVQASVGFAPSKHWAWTVKPGTPTAVLPLDLAGLPTTINTDLRVDVQYKTGKNLTIWRRLMRTPMPASGGVVQIDHSTMTLRVDGDIFQGTGWFFGIPTWPPVHWLPCTRPPINKTECTALWLATIRPRADLGTLSMMMPYGLASLHPIAQLAFLDACTLLGVKVQYDIVKLGMSALGGMNFDTDWASPTWRADVESNVTLVGNHSAILGFYVSTTTNPHVQPAACDAPLGCTAS
jgi:hypothetical protein